MSKIKLEKIGLATADGQEVSLTIKEAKELYEQLHELFGSKTTYVPYNPVYIERYRDPWITRPYYTYDWTYRPDTVTYTSSNTNMRVDYSGTAIE